MDIYCRVDTVNRVSISSENKAIDQFGCITIGHLLRENFLSHFLAFLLLSLALTPRVERN